MAQQQASISVDGRGHRAMPSPSPRSLLCPLLQVTVGCQDLGGLGAKLQAQGEGGADCSFLSWGGGPASRPSPQGPDCWPQGFSGMSVVPSP